MDIRFKNASERKSASQASCPVWPQVLLLYYYYSIKSLAGELKKKKLLAVYCKLTFVAKSLTGPLSCDCKNACVFHSRQQILRMY